MVTVMVKQDGKFKKIVTNVYKADRMATSLRQMGLEVTIFPVEI